MSITHLVRKTLPGRSPDAAPNPASPPPVEPTGSGDESNTRTREYIARSLSLEPETPMTNDGEPEVYSRSALSTIDIKGANPAPQGPSQTEQNLINNLIAFIPSEIIAIYIALLSMSNASSTMPESNLDNYAYGLCLMLAPIFAIGLRLSLMRTISINNGENFSIKEALDSRIYFIAVAALVSFAIWGLAMPEGPYNEGEVRIVATMLAIVISPLLAMVGKVFFGNDFLR